MIPIEARAYMNVSHKFADSHGTCLLQVSCTFSLIQVSKPKGLGIAISISSAIRVNNHTDNRNMADAAHISSRQ
jgi:hypothetical protein